MRERPKPSSEAVRKFMQRVKRTNTGPEIALRSALHRLGLRFRIHRRDLPGRPDIVFPGAKLVVFMDGCFWHGCPIHHVDPKANAVFWRKKVEENQARDDRNNLLLNTLGWEVIRVWEHEDVGEAAKKIATIVQQRRNR
jgi:DNA mismatch endonuclease, patch repair protein